VRPALQFDAAPARLVHVAGTPDAVSGSYVYQLQHEGLVQRGVAGLVCVADYRRGVIRRHEHVDRAEVRRRVRRLVADPRQRSPVLLAYRDDAGIAELMSADTAQPPLAVTVTDDGVQHTLWRARDAAAYRAAFAAHSAAWIADGHHRFASVSRAAALWRRAHPQRAGEAPEERVLAVLMPASALRILPYHRVLSDLGPEGAEGFLQRVAAPGRLEQGLETTALPPGRCALYASGRWYTLHRPSTETATADQRGLLDHDWLQRDVLGPCLGVRDAVADPRVRCVPGRADLWTLAAAVDRGEAAVAVAMPAVSMDEVMRVADAGMVMPAKSTWFSPKLRGGLLSYRLGG